MSQNLEIIWIGKQEEFTVGLAMRFPRIKKVRLESADGDEKKASETSTDEELWRMFDEARSKRLDMDSMIGTQTQNDATIAFGSRGCRFLTPDEYRKKSRKRKKKVLTSPSRKVPKVETYESNVLEGLSFCVLEGMYFLDLTSFEARATQHEGWAHTAEKVKTEEDVIKFIKKHGGSYRAKATGSQNEYIVGGSKDDARVKTQIDGLRYGKTLADSKKKADKSLASVAQRHNGILKWTFVYYLVHMLQKETKERSSNGVRDAYLIPEPHHYLVRVSRDESIEEALFMINRPISIEEMEHALAAPIATNNYPWQLKGSTELPKEERWTLSTDFTSLWPYNTNEGCTQHSVVLYPDIFSSGYGFSAENEATEELSSNSKSSRWINVEAGFDEITSILPLVCTMGGSVTPHLHSGVTHIACLLKDDSEISVEHAKSNDLFLGKERGVALLEYISHNFPETNQMKLVSPRWIRNKLNSAIK